MNHALDPATALQIAGLAISGKRPLLVCDADEVLLKFIEGLERFLATRDLFLDLSTYALHGNVKRKSDNHIVTHDEVSALLRDFFTDAAHGLEAVAGAADALATLNADADIVILSNVPLKGATARAHNLHALGMNYPLVANTGAKGPALAAIAARAPGCSVVFIDDLPHNIKSAAEAVSYSTRLHFVADERLSRMMPTSPHAHFRPRDWPDAADYIGRVINGP